MLKSMTRLSVVGTLSWGTKGGGGTQERRTRTRMLCGTSAVLAAVWRCQRFATPSLDPPPATSGSVLFSVHKTLLIGSAEPLICTMPGVPAKYAGDPRRPGEARPFHPSMFSPDVVTPDFYLIVALLLSMGAMLLKQRAALWSALILLSVAIANANFASEDNVKQLFSVVTICAFTLFSIYIEFGKAVSSSSGASKTADWPPRQP